MKVVINKCYGGFGLSHEAMMRYAEIKGFKLYPEEEEFGLVTYWKIPKSERMDVSLRGPSEWNKLSLEDRQKFNQQWSEQTVYDRDIERNDPALIQVVEELGEKSSGNYAKLSIVNIPDGVDWEIEEYDGTEWIAEKHRTWS